MRSSQASTDLSYSPIEVHSYLPPGWNVEQDEGHFDDRRQRWSIDVQDVSELVSKLEVKVKDADRLGRIPALRAAIHALVRKR